MNFSLRHRVVKFPSVKSQKNISAWNPLYDIVSQSFSRNIQQKEYLPCLCPLPLPVRWLRHFLCSFFTSVYFI